MKLEDFPIGSAQSRAAARAESERRLRREDQTSTIIIWTGLPCPIRERETPLINPPDTVEYFAMPDESIVEVIRRHWKDGNARGLTISIDQTWPDGNIYHGNCEVLNLAGLKAGRRVSHK